MNDLVVKRLDFIDNTIDVEVFSKDDEPYFNPRRACEHMQLSWGSQWTKIKKHPERYSWIEVSTKGRDGKTYTMVGMPARQFNRWVLDINPDYIKGKNAETKKDLVRKYQSQLEEWLHARNFLTREEIATVQDVAVSRGAVGLTVEIDSLIAMPTSTPELAKWRDDRVVQLTDEHLGFVTPQLSTRKSELTPNSFHRRWVVEGSCDDRMIILLPELYNSGGIQKYAIEHGMSRKELPLLPLGFTQKAELAKRHIQFNHSIEYLVVAYNYPASLIHSSIWEMNCFLLGVFKQQEVLLKDPIEWEARKEQYRHYTQKMHEWRLKREAFFAVFNCCIDCGWPKGREITSKNFEAHHHHYQTVGREHPYDLVPLCGPCHKVREHKRKKSYVLD